VDFTKEAARPLKCSKRGNQFESWICVLVELVGLEPTTSSLRILKSELQGVKPNEDK